MDISIIIPVYNAEKYVIKCLDSIFHQQFSGSLEVIAVNDASTDNSLRILQEYQEKEQRLVLLSHDINRKQSAARSLGMDASKGDYIMHVDADDWLLPNALELLFQKCKQTNSDIIVFDVIREDSEGNTTPVNLIEKELTTSNKLKVEKQFFGSTCNKIVRKKLTGNLISGTAGVNTTEDLLYAIEILLRAETITLTPDIYYVYYINRSSVMWSFRPDQYLDNQCIILDYLYKIVAAYNPSKEFVTRVLGYIEKKVLYQIGRLHFQQNEKYKNGDLLGRKFLVFPHYGKWRISCISRSVYSKYFCLLCILVRLGPRSAGSVFLRSILKFTN
jgi:glycosyltransferase involved in cell wall biosynthesis